ncbi:hypothetical protein [Umezawaea sp. Da 62-37]|uniref:hypothetical protein n=1 Tax=Umezawaea sp. Da 62-37 TaxID=3075927 RepID=UPI0028F6DB47|nr:hypothetical protein [Umezawaea sp. Da 62-37]WNV90364.1 hypothetical protein RM788_19410 [Umezawaea sp. Da 62-37]
MDIDSRLDRIRGPVEPTPHNARTIAALTNNPGCTRRRVIDAAFIDKAALAAQIGHPFPYGMSPFAITRGKSFEALVTANGCAELLRLLREVIGLPLPEVSYDDLGSVAGRETLQARHIRSRQLLTEATRSGEDSGTLFDHPLLKLDVSGRAVYLEPDLIAFRIGHSFRVVEIKSFPILDRQADPAKVKAAAIQSAVYVLALQQFMVGLGFTPDLVSHKIVLVCPENFSNRPTAAEIDVRREVAVLRRQLHRLSTLDVVLAGLPKRFVLDTTRSPTALLDALALLEARYVPECLSSCEMAYLCRSEAAGRTAALGRTVQEHLGGIETVSSVLALATGVQTPDEHEVESAARLRAAEQLRRECLGGVA